MAIDDNASYELTGYQVKDLAQKIRAKADSASLASVATSGLYSDLTGAPTIPTVYNGTLTIQQNGTTLGTFSANQDTNETINITGGGGATVTEFYLDSYPGNATHVYKDSSLQTLAAASDINDALDDGPVRLVDGSHEYEIVRYDKYGGMASNGSWCVYDGTEVYYMSFVDNTTLFWDSFVLQEQLTAGTNISIDPVTYTISATDTTYSAFTGATSSVAGTAGLVPAPAAGDEGKVLHGDGTWKDTTAKLVEMSYGESNAWAKFIAAYNAGSIVYCRASSNANPGTGSQTRKAFMAYVNNATNPTNVEFQYVRSQSSKTDSQQCDQIFVYTLTNASGGTWSVASRNMGPKVNVSGPITKTFTSGANATITIGADTMTGATSSAAGATGVVPAPAAGDQNKVLTGDGTWKALTNVLYPIGSIYMSATLATAADVEAALGGTWAAWGAGRVPVGVDTSDTDFDTAEETGGEKTHTLTTQEMPSHSHDVRGNLKTQGSGAQFRELGREAGTNNGSTEPTGGGQAHNNLQPYITCYMYKRTA